MAQIYTSAPRTSDLWGAIRPEDPGYTYNGVVNMNAAPGSQGRLDRILRTAEIIRMSRTVVLVLTKTLRKSTGIYTEPRRNSQHARSTDTDSSLIYP